MSQNDLGTLVAGATSGAQLAALLRNWRDAEHSSHSGAARPSYVVPGMLWLDTSTTPWALKLWTGTVDAVVARMNPATGEITTFNAGRWREHARIEAATLIGFGAWAYDLPDDANRFRITFLGTGTTAGDASIFLRCGPAADAADAGASEYFQQFIYDDAVTLQRGSSLSSLFSLMSISTSGVHHAVVDGAIGSADTNWQVLTRQRSSSTTQNFFGSAACIRNAAGRRSRLFIGVTGGATLGRGKITIEVAP